MDGYIYASVILLHYCFLFSLFIQILSLISSCFFLHLHFLYLFSLLMFSSLSLCFPFVLSFPSSSSFQLILDLVGHLFQVNLRVWLIFPLIFSVKLFRPFCTMCTLICTHAHMCIRVCMLMLVSLFIFLSA